MTPEPLDTSMKGLPSSLTQLDRPKKLVVEPFITRILSLPPLDRSTLHSADGALWLSKSSYTWRRTAFILPEYSAIVPRELGHSLSVLKSQNITEPIPVVLACDGKSVLEAVQILAELSDYAKLQRVGPWNFFVNIEMVYGHFTEAQSPGFNPDDDARQLFRPKSLSPELQKWKKRILASLLRLWDTGDFINSFDVWLLNYDWASSGSSTWKPNNLKTKAQLAEGQPILSVAKHAKDARVFHVTPVVKLEPSKVRTAYNVDTSLFLFGAWAIQSLRPLRQHTLLGSEEWLIERWLMEAKPLCGDVCFPLDYSGWDKNNVEKEDTLFILKWLRKRHPSPDWAFLDVPVIYHNPATGVRIPWEGGMLSGAAWTSLFNSLINYATSLALCMMCGGPPTLINCTGDDAYLNLRHDHALRVIMLAPKLGLSLNPRKMFISRDSSEYLRIYVDFRQKTLLRYPMRSLPATIQRKPWSSEPLTRIDRLVALFGSLITLTKRAGVPFQPAPIAYECTRSNVSHFYKYQLNPSGYSTGEIPAVWKLPNFRSAPTRNIPMYRSKALLSKYNLVESVSKALIRARLNGLFPPKGPDLRKPKVLPILRKPRLVGPHAKPMLASPLPAISQEVARVAERKADLSPVWPQWASLKFAKHWSSLSFTVDLSALNTKTSIAYNNMLLTSTANKLVRFALASANPRLRFPFSSRSILKFHTTPAWGEVPLPYPQGWSFFS